MAMSVYGKASSEAAVFISLGCSQPDSENVITKDQTSIASQIPAEGGEGRAGLFFCCAWGLIRTRARTHVHNTAAGPRPPENHLPLRVGVETPRREGPLFPWRLRRSCSSLCPRDRLGKQQPAPEIDAVGQGHKEVTSFSWGWWLLSHRPAEGGLMWGPGGSILSIGFGVYIQLFFD